jgi:hypothetical protein
MTKKDSNLTSKDIIKHFEAKASEVHVNENLVSQEAAMVAKYKKVYPSPPCDKAKAKCLNCQVKGHMNESCWEKGGGAEGKTPDWWKGLKKKKGGGEKGDKKKREKANAALKKVDSSGSESRTAFIESVDPTPAIITEKSISTPP